MLVISVGKGTHGFTLDREIGNFILTHANLQIPADTGEFAINTSNARFWEPPVHRYVTECQAGKTGDRGRDFNMRWIASMVAEVHRILMRGGVFMYPKDTKDRANRVGFACCTRRTRLACSWSRPEAVPRRETSGCWKSMPETPCISASR